MLTRKQANTKQAKVPYFHCGPFKTKFKKMKGWKEHGKKIDDIRF